MAIRGSRGTPPGKLGGDYDFAGLARRRRVVEPVSDEGELEAPIDNDEVPDFAYAYANFATDFYWIDGTTVGIESFLAEDAFRRGTWVANEGGIIPGFGLASSYTETTAQGDPILHPTLVAHMMESAATTAGWSMLAVCNVPVITPFTESTMIRVQPFQSSTAVVEWDLNSGPSIPDRYDFDYTGTIGQAVALEAVTKVHDFGAVDTDQEAIFTLESIIGIGYKLAQLESATGYRAFMCTSNAPSVETAAIDFPVTVVDEIALVVSSFSNSAFIRTLTIYVPARSDAEMVALAIEASIV